MARVSACDDRQLDEAGGVGRAVDALRRLDVAGGRREEDIRHECLRVPVVERKPARLHLHHDAVTGKKDVIRGRQRELVGQRLSRRNRLRRREALAVAAAENIHRDAQFVAAHLRLARHRLRKDVDQLHDPVAVRAARRGDEMHDRSARNLDGLGQHRCRIAQHVRPVVDHALIDQQPAAPGVAVRKPDRARLVGHWFGGIGYVLVKAVVARGWSAAA